MLLHDLTLKWICTHELIEIGIIRQIYIYNTKQSDFLLIWSIQQLNSSIWWKTFPRISSVSHVRLLFVVYIYAPLSLSNPNILRVGLPTWFIRHHLVVMYVKVYGVYVDVYGELSSVAALVKFLLRFVFVSFFVFIFFSFRFRFVFLSKTKTIVSLTNFSLTIVNVRFRFRFAIF
jgi:ABC-type cobalamin transport system permease subunit